MNFQILKGEDGTDTNDFILLIEEDGTKRVVPNAADNRHWKMYQAWLAEGNSPLASE